MTEAQKKRLEQKLWDIANMLRGKMNPDEFRDYILGFIFFKYLSDRLTIYADGVLEPDNVKFVDLDASTAVGKQYLEALQKEAVQSIGYFLPPSDLFASIAKRARQPDAFVIPDLERILDGIERSTMGTESEEDFDSLFDEMNLKSDKLGKTEDAKNELVSKILIHLDGIDFRLDEVDADVLGDAYEYLIGMFASGAGKKAGEFYTPQSVSTILARIVSTGKDRLRSVYDPTCGSGSLLLRVAKEVKQVGDFYGQEMNQTTYNLARMNMILHGVSYRNFRIHQEDTLESPMHMGQTFEAIVANPPFSADWSAREMFKSDDRFSDYGRLAPRTKADYAFICHMLHHLDENGTMAVVLPHGALFRGAAEGEIRKHIIAEKNWLDAVIGLPAGIFYGTGIPTCIMVFKKCREREDILFIDASSEFVKGKNQNNLDEHSINRIVAGFRNRFVIPKFSHLASREEVAANDYNLNIPLYVDTFVPEEAIHLTAIATDLKAASEVSDLADSVIQKFCVTLGVRPPIGSNLPSLTLFKRGLMQALFSQTVRFTKVDGTAYPDWEVRRLGEFAKKTSSTVTAQSLENNDGQFPVFGASGFIKGITFFVSEVEHISIVKDGAGVGRLMLCPKNSSVLGTLDSLVGKGDCSTAFLYHLLSTINFQRYITGSTIPHIYFRDYSKLRLSLPHPDEQQKIADALSAMDAKISTVSGQVAQMEDFKKGLLQQMFV